MRTYTLYYKWYTPSSWTEGQCSSSFGPSNAWNLAIRFSCFENTRYLSLCRQKPGPRLKLKCHVMTNLCTTYFEASMDKLSTLLRLPNHSVELVQNNVLFVEINFDVTEMEPSDEETNVNEKEVQTDSDFSILNVPGKSAATMDTNALISLSRDMQTMYEEHHHSDFTVICGSETFHVHKCVLSARSPVFASMLQHPMNETVENRMIIPDIDAVVLDQLVSFMYTGRINELSYPTARDLYSACDKYAVLQLKDKCGEFLISSLCTSTAIEVLILGDMHNDIMLKNAAIIYISDHFKDLNTTEAWLTFVKEHSALAIEVLYSAMSNLKSKLQIRK